MSVQRRKKNSISMLIPFVVFALFFSIMIYQKYRVSDDIYPVPSRQENEAIRSVILFFAKDGVQLVREAREIEPCDDDNACLESIMDELLNGPVGGLDETIPAGTVVESVSMAGSQVTIDFNNAFAEGLLSGSSAEMVAVYSVVDTVAVNFPHIQTVKININGNTGAILRHLDLSDPLTPDYAMENLPSGSRAAGANNISKDSGKGASR